MSLDDYTSQGFLRRWRILDGQPRCPHNAVDPARISDADRVAILAQNADVRAKMESVTAYEAAERIRAGEPPERYEEVIEEEGDEPVRRETDTYEAWKAAGKVIDDATIETVALADIRAGTDPEREPDVVPEDTLVQIEPRPEFKPLSAMQLAAILLRIGKIPAPEARAFGRAGVIPQVIEAGVLAALSAAGLPEDDQQIALLKLESATEYHRDHQLTPMIGQALDLDAAELDAVWAAGAQIL